MVHVLRHFPDFYNNKFKKLTIFYLESAAQPQVYGNLFKFLPADVTIQRYDNLDAAALRAENLAASDPDEYAAVVLDDQLSRLLKPSSTQEQSLTKIFIAAVHHSKITVRVRFMKFDSGYVTNDFSVQLFVLLQAANFKSSLLSLLLNNSRYIYMCFYDSYFTQSAVLQRAFFPGAQRNFLARLVNFLKNRGRTHLLLDVAKQKVYTNLWSPFLEIVTIGSVSEKTTDQGTSL